MGHYFKYYVRKGLNLLKFLQGISQVAKEANGNLIFSQIGMVNFLETVTTFSKVTLLIFMLQHIGNNKASFTYN